MTTAARTCCRSSAAVGSARSPIGSRSSRAFYDRPAVARTRSDVIDGRLLLLGLARIDDDLAELLLRTGLRWRLKRDLGFPPEAVLAPWAPCAEDRSR